MTSRVLDQFGYYHMYIGAFTALGIDNSRIAIDLAALTESDADAFEAIRIMARAAEGDRVHLALSHLRDRHDAVRNPKG